MVVEGVGAEVHTNTASMTLRSVGRRASRFKTNRHKDPMHIKKRALASMPATTS